MNRILALAWTLIIVPTVAGGQDLPQKLDRPASARDLLTDAILPFAHESEEGRFLKAAGEDGELSQVEFDADKAAGDGFVRKFDDWHSLTSFDAGPVSPVAWHAAVAYREAI